MRYLTAEECRAFGEPGSQNETTPVLENGIVVAVLIYTQHASGTREARRRDHGHPTYGRMVETADKALAEKPQDLAAEYNARFDPAYEAGFELWCAAYKLGWLSARYPDGDDGGDEGDEAYRRWVDGVELGESFDAHRDAFFAHLPLQAVGKAP